MIFSYTQRGKRAVIYSTIKYGCYFYLQRKFYEQKNQTLLDPKVTLYFIMHSTSLVQYMYHTLRLYFMITKLNDCTKQQSTSYQFILVQYRQFKHVQALSERIWGWLLW